MMGKTIVVEGIEYASQGDYDRIASLSYEERCPICHEFLAEDRQQGVAGPTSWIMQWDIGHGKVERTMPEGIQGGIYEDCRACMWRHWQMRRDDGVFYYWRQPLLDESAEKAISDCSPECADRVRDALYHNPNEQWRAWLYRMWVDHIGYHLPSEVDNPWVVTLEDGVYDTLLGDLEN